MTFHFSRDRPRIEWKTTLLPVLLVGIAYLLTLGPLFRNYNNGLFIAALALSAHHGGTRAGVFALVLTLPVLVFSANPWWRDRTPMAYFSFTFAAIVILWQQHSLRLSQERLRRHELALAHREAALVGQKVAKGSHKMVELLSAISMQAQTITSDGPQSIEAITSLAQKGGKILSEITAEARRLDGSNNTH